MTHLTKPVSRTTRITYHRRPIVITLAPAGSQPEALLSFRLKGTRTEYVCAASQLFRLAAMWHGQKENAARAAARKAGVPWRIAKRQFAAANSLSR